MKTMPPEVRLKYDMSGDKLPEEYVEAGYHYCADWDYIIIGPEDPEHEVCTCTLRRIKK